MVWMVAAPTAFPTTFHLKLPILTSWVIWIQGTKYPCWRTTCMCAALFDMGVPIFLFNGKGMEQPGWQLTKMCSTSQHHGEATAVHATWLIHMIFHIEIHKQKLYIFPYVELRLFYAIKRNLKIVIEQPGSSVPCFQKGSDGYRWANETTMNNQIENKITWTHCYIVPVRTPYGETYP
jgi:hypothetical protein